jgi:hypothetical protein
LVFGLWFLFTIEGSSLRGVQSTKLKVQLPTTDVLVGIDDSNNRAIGRRVFPLEGKAGFLSPAPENQLTYPGAGGIDGHQGFTLWSEIFIERLNDEQLATVQRRVLYRCYDGTDDAGDLHINSWA